MNDIFGFPAPRPGAGIVVPVSRAGVDPRAPAAKLVPALTLPDAVEPTSRGTVRHADGLQARFGHVLQAGAPALHAHELAELRHIITQPPYYSPVKLATLLVRTAAYRVSRVFVWVVAQNMQPMPKY